MTRRIAILPARGGSKRIPHKNIRDFCGKPMISYILSAAAASRLFEVIHVSTDSADVADVVTKLGFAPAFSRPQELADDFTPLMPVLKHVVAEYQRRGQTFDQVCLLYACAPMIEASDLQSAANIFDAAIGTEGLIAVTNYDSPIEWAFDLVGHELHPVQPGMFLVRSQDLKTRHHSTGTFAFFSTARVLRDGPPSDRNYFGYVLPRHKALDIDNEEDWDFAERLYRGSMVMARKTP